jgi:hypothetical protein
MATSGFKLDIAGFEKQIEKLKKNIALGVIDGFEDASEYLKNIMKFYIDEVVYQAYQPKIYERTYELRDNVTAKIVGDTLFVYVDDQGMDKPNGQWSYPWRVILGDDIYPYNYPVEGAGFMEPRNFREVTRDEFISHMNQSQEFIRIIIRAVERRI